MPPREVRVLSLICQLVLLRVILLLRHHLPANNILGAQLQHSLYNRRQVYEVAGTPPQLTGQLETEVEKQMERRDRVAISFVKVLRRHPRPEGRGRPKQ